MLSCFERDASPSMKEAGAVQSSKQRRLPNFFLKLPLNIDAQELPAYRDMPH